MKKIQSLKAQNLPKAVIHENSIGKNNISRSNHKIKRIILLAGVNYLLVIIFNIVFVKIWQIWTRDTSNAGEFGAFVLLTLFTIPIFCMLSSAIAILLNKDKCLSHNQLFIFLINAGLAVYFYLIASALNMAIFLILLISYYSLILIN